MRYYCIALVSTALLIMSMAGANAQPVIEWQDELKQAKQAVVTGKSAEAIGHYQRAAAVSPNDDKTAEIMLELGGVYGRKDLQNSAQAYCQAKDLASGQLRLQAGNNCATQLLRLGNDQQALDLMQDLWSEFRNAELSPVARSRVLYNYALALEKTGRSEFAKDYYQQAYDADPGFNPAAQAVARYALSSSSEGIGTWL